MTVTHEEMKAVIDRCGLVITGCCCGGHYTIGMSKLGLPDMILMGNLSPQTVMYTFNSLSLKLRRFGLLTGVVGDLYEQADGSDATVFIQEITSRPAIRSVLDNHMVELEGFYAANPEYIGENGINVVQVMWPDLSGYYPNHEQYDHESFPQEVLSKVLYGH